MRFSKKISRQMFYAIICLFAFVAIFIIPEIVALKKNADKEKTIPIQLAPENSTTVNIFPPATISDTESSVDIAIQSEASNDTNQQELPANLAEETPNITADALVVPPFPMPEIIQPIFPNTICNIIDYGAKTDENFLNTQAFSSAIEDCSKKGGGRVFVPAGVWLTGSIHLKSNINLDLEEGSEIIFSDNPDDYLPIVLTRNEGVEVYNYSPLIYAKDAFNIAITGKGKLNGQGNIWWKKNNDEATKGLFAMAANEIPVSNRIFGTKKQMLRPSFIEFVHCNSILLENFSIVNGPMWTIQPVYSSNIIIRGVDVMTEGGLNTDGIVIDSSRNVLIENATLSTGDDAIVIKSGRDKDGLRVNIPSENIVIRDCKVKLGHGGFAIGSEVSGGIRNVFVYNCDFDRTDNGIRIKSAIGRGGFVEDIWIENINMRRIIYNAIQITMNYDLRAIPNNNDLSKFYNINISNINCQRTKNIAVIDGLENNYIDGISLDKISVSSAVQGFVIKNASNINLTGIKAAVRTYPIFKFNNTDNILIDNLPCKKTKSCVLR